MKIRLSQAPDIYFDQGQWGDFSARFETKEIALVRISGPPCTAEGYHKSGDPSLPSSEGERTSWTHVTFELGNALIRALKVRLIAGEIEATGIPFHIEDRISIGAEEWENLWPQFCDESAMGAARFEHVFLHDTTNPKILANAVQRKMTDWLLDQAKIRSSSKRDLLLLDAKSHFGPAFTNTIFNAAYSIAFKKARGRPGTQRK